mmetsp:Transcript_47449/g.86885  ORF Transcript_47449/g.86885 Transcript_47449/m.86885 type:complete len:239 (+) Transcript_47449:54-770(+)
MRDRTTLFVSSARLTADIPWHWLHHTPRWSSVPLMSLQAPEVGRSQRHSGERPPLLDWLLLAELTGLQHYVVVRRSSPWPLEQSPCHASELLPFVLPGHLLALALAAEGCAYSAEPPPTQSSALHSQGHWRLTSSRGHLPTLCSRSSPSPVPCLPLAVLASALTAASRCALPLTLLSCCQRASWRDVARVRLQQRLLQSLQCHSGSPSSAQSAFRRTVPVHSSARAGAEAHAFCLDPG